MKDITFFLLVFDVLTLTEWCFLSMLLFLHWSGVNNVLVIILSVVNLIFQFLCRNILNHFHKKNGL